MKILWILPKWPYPAVDGAKKAHMALLKNWPVGSELDLVVYTDGPKPAEEIETLRQLIGFKQLLLLPFAKIPKFLIFFLSLFSTDSLSTTVKRFASGEAKSLWRNWSKNQKWDVVVFDGLHPAGLFFENNKWSLPQARGICLRAHNVESEIWEQTHERGSFLLKWILNIEKKRIARFEKSFLKVCDLIVPVSAVDAEKFKALIDKPLAIIPAPIGMAWKDLPAPVNATNELALLFIGRLDWYPNEEGLAWFLEKVWPIIVEEKKINITLHVIGSHGKSKLVKIIESAKNVIYHGQVEDLTPFYSQIALTVIPIFIGSGTRVKAIESALHGRSFISTTKGIEGVSLQAGVDYIEANSEEEWIKAIEALSINTCASLGQHIHLKMKETYDQDIIQAQLVSQLQLIVDIKK